jgi:glycosyltransferase involved in cell wall biosynthesis
MNIKDQTNKASVISIGYGRHLFKEGNVERLRMEACARKTNTYNMVVFTRPSDGFKSTSHSSGLVLHPVTSRFSFLKIFKAVFKVRKIIKMYSGRVVVSTQDPFETALVGWLATRFSSAELNIQEHGDVFSTKYWRSEKPLNIPRFYFGLFFLRRADSVRVVAKRIVDTLIKYGVKKQKITQFAVMTDPIPFVDLTSNKEARNLFPEGSFVFLTVARLVSQKNIHLLLRSFYRAQQNCPDIRLLIAGSGSDQASLETLIKLNEKDENQSLVKMLPWLNDVPGFMADVDAYVLSSNYEGWARVLIEAKYANLPMVTTDVGCVGEEVVDKKHGLVVPVDDENELSLALEKMANEEDQYAHYKNILETEPLPEGVSYDGYAEKWISSFD